MFLGPKRVWIKGWWSRYRPRNKNRNG